MEKWQVELYGTPLWLLQSFVGVVIACVLLVICLKNTHFGKQFHQVVTPCLTQQNRKKILLVLAAMLLLLLLLEVRFSVLNTFFYNGLYSSLEKK